MTVTRMLLLLLILAAAAAGAHDETSEPRKLYQSIVIKATPIDPALDRRNGEVFDKSLFSRDDQVFHLLDAGISAGQHEGGGKSVEIRRFGFNLDHGGVNGGLKVLVDDIPQNQTTQGHGQGYLGSLKGMSPELVRDVEVHNGPFRAEYGDFSGLGVVHILQRESLPDEFTARVQGGSFGTKRGFFGWSPDLKSTDAYVAYEGAYSDGPFVKPLGYRRDNVSGNLTRRFTDRTSAGARLNISRNDFLSSGQLPLDEVAAGRLDRFGFLDPGDGGQYRSGVLAAYLRREQSNGAVWKLDGFASRSLFDLYSNFTFALDDEERGDGIQQHDSRLQQGANLQYSRPHKQTGVLGVLSIGANYHGNQNLVGLASRFHRTPIAVRTLAHANVQNTAGYIQDNLSLWNGRIQVGGGVRYDNFRFAVDDRVSPEGTGTANSGRFQPKANFSVTPSLRWPMTLHFNYGRGISSLDARGVVTTPGARHLAATDFHQAGVSHHFSRFSLVATAFWIDRSNELVYIPDDGSLQFAGPSRAYGYELKTSVQLTRRIAFNGGLTKVLNAVYRGTEPREYVVRAPRFTANAGLTLSEWRGWSGSLRFRTINRYRLDGEDPTVLAAGHAVFDFGLTRRIRRGLDLQFGLDNMLNRSYYETQNYFESRLQGQDPMYRIHGTPGYPITVTVGLSFRFRGK